MVEDRISALMEPESDDQVIWRYLSYPKLLSLLYTEELRFTRADKFADPLEGYLPLKALLKWTEQSHQQNQQTAKAWDLGDEIDLVKGLMERNPIKALKNQKNQAFISCWNSADQESLSLWKDYTPAGKGVVIKSTVGRLKEAIQDIKIENLSIGEVRYCDVKKDLGPAVKDYAQYPFAYKDCEYSDEQEFRAILFEKGYDEEEYQFLQCQDMVANKTEYKDYRRGSTPVVMGPDPTYRQQPVTTGVKLDTLVEEIRISPYSRGWQRSTLESVVTNQFKHSITIQESSLDVESESRKPSTDRTPSELYSKIQEDEFLTLEDLANLDYDFS